VPDLEIVGGHVHARLTDPSGFQATAADALDALEAAGPHGVVFAVSEPAGDREANDAVLNLGERTGRDTRRTFASERAAGRLTDPSGGKPAVTRPPGLGGPGPSFTQTGRSPPTLRQLTRRCHEYFRSR
jgi:hypothetical protein